MNGIHELGWVTLAGATAFGGLLAFWGDLQPHLTERFADAPRKSPALASAFHLALAPFMVIAGILADLWGGQETLFLGALLAGLAVCTLALGRTFRNTVGASVLAAAGASGLNVGAITLMPAAFEFNNAVAAVNLGFVFVGLGALLLPLLVRGLRRAIGVRRALLLFAVLCLLPAVPAVLVQGPAAGPSETPELGGLLSNPFLWFAAAAFLCYGPLEAVLGTAGPWHLSGLGCTPRRAALLLAPVWLVFLWSRLAAAAAVHQEVLSPISDVWLVPGLGLGVVITLGYLASTHTRPAAVWGLILVAACLGPVLPTLAGVVLKSVPANVDGTAYGLVYAAGSVGSLVLAPLYRPADDKRPRLGPQLFTGVALVLAGFALALALS